jgi:acyl-CoA thioester hydrolase
MPLVFEYPHTVGNDEIDQQRHANNVAFMEWLQAAAIAHSAAQGWPGERYRQLGQGWVVRSHYIEYLQQAFAGDQIVVETWIASTKKATSVRRYKIFRLPDRQLLAKAETHWAFIDFTTGKPIRIPEVVASSFQVVDQ